MKLVHVFDACCGWSHGLSRTLCEVGGGHLPEDRREGRTRRRRRGTDFPSLPAVDGDPVTVPAHGNATADEIDQRLAALRMP